MFGIKTTATIGGSIASAHAGLTLGATYNSSEDIVTIEGMEHLGFGAGEKAGIKFEIRGQLIRDIYNFFSQNQ